MAPISARSFVSSVLQQGGELCGWVPACTCGIGQGSFLAQISSILAHPDENIYTLNAWWRFLAQAQAITEDGSWFAGGRQQPSLRGCLCWAMWGQAGAPAGCTQDTAHSLWAARGPPASSQHFTICLCIPFSSWFSSHCFLCNSLHSSLCQIFRLCLMLCKGILHRYFYFNVSHWSCCTAHRLDCCLGFKCTSQWL